MSLKKAVEFIKRNKRFLITSHTNLEGDALGSEIAFYFLLKKLGKRAFIVNEDASPYGYDFLPGQNKIKRLKLVFKKKPDFDCFVTLDCSDLKRAGETWKINRDKKPVLNIDHHISNQRFGEVNWVEPDASSCAQMVYRLYKKLGIRLDEDVAISLYTGIVCDTGSFRYSNTTSFTHRIAAELLKFRIDVVGIYRAIYENIPFEDMRLLIKILPGIRRKEKGRIIWFKLPRHLLRRKKLSFDLSEQVLSFGRAIKGVEVVVLFKENFGAMNQIRVNFRSNGDIDVNKIARFFGGGGHKTASGATINGRLDDVARKVLAKIKENLR